MRRVGIYVFTVIFKLFFFHIIFLMILKTNYIVNVIKKSLNVRK